MDEATELYLYFKKSGFLGSLCLAFEKESKEAGMPNDYDKLLKELGEEEHLVPVFDFEKKSVEYIKKKSK